MVLLWRFWTKHLWVPPSAQGFDARLGSGKRLCGSIHLCSVCTGSLAVAAMKWNLNGTGLSDSKV